jgi:hypothetical protein
VAADGEGGAIDGDPVDAVGDGGGVMEVAGVVAVP